MKLEAYLFFPGNTEEAMNHYRSVLGGDLAITRRGDVDPTAPEDERHLVINAALTPERSHCGRATGPTRRTRSRPGSN